VQLNVPGSFQGGVSDLKSKVMSITSTSGKAPLGRGVMARRKAYARW
jgi:hypothetical protein